MLLCERLVLLAQGGAPRLNVFNPRALAVDQCAVGAAQANQCLQLRVTAHVLLGILDAVLDHVGQRCELVAAHHEQRALVVQRYRALAVGGVVGHVAHQGVARGGARLVRGQRHAAGQPVQQFQQVFRAVHHHAGAEGGRVIAPVQRAQHVLGVVEVILVDLELRAVLGLEVAQLDPAFALRISQRRGALAENQDVGDDGGAGVLLESTRGQAERGQQLALLGQLHARGAALLVHRAGAGDAHHQAAGPGLVQSLQEEEVMQRWVQRGVAAHAGRAVAGERPIAHHQVVEPVSGLAVLVALDLDVRVGVQQLRHGPGGLVKLDAGKLAVLHDVAGHQTVEVADAHAGLQRAAAFEAHRAQHGPHGRDRGRVGVVRVDDRVLRTLPGFFAQALAQPLVFLLPALLLARAVPTAVEQVLPERAPADVGGHRVQFGRQRRAAFAGDGVERFERGAVARESDLGGAPDQPGGIVDVVIRSSGSSDSACSGSISSQSLSACSAASVGGIPAALFAFSAWYIRCHRTCAICGRTFRRSRRATICGRLRRQWRVRSASAGLPRGDSWAISRLLRVVHCARVASNWLVGIVSVLL